MECGKRDLVSTLDSLTHNVHYTPQDYTGYSLVRHTRPEDGLIEKGRNM